MSDELRTDLREIREDIKSLLTLQASTNAKLDAHMGNETIHVKSPCKAHETLACRLWAVALLAVASGASALWSILTKGNQ